MENQTNFKNVLSTLLSRLTDREQDVLKHRYQLTSDLDKSATLKKIGDTYNITRERVRQIERDALQKLIDLKKQNEFAGQLVDLETALTSFIERQGGLVREDNLLDNFATKNYQFDNFHPNAYLFVMENLFNGVTKLEDHDYFYSIWKLDNFDENHVVDLVTKIENSLKDGSKLYSEEDILGLADSHVSADLSSAIAEYLGKHSDLDRNDLLRSYLASTSRIENNILNEWGLTGWENVTPRKLSAKIHLVFKKEQKPLHFRDIAETINQAKFDHKNICPATVHNELIANDKYVLIGRGIYALKDWGYSNGTVADVITKILQEAGKPLTKEEIYEKVLKQRQVNRSTIYLTLINKDKFEKIGDGMFNIK